MPVFDEGRKAEMYLFFSVAFGAAPGVTYWTQLEEAVESGMSAREIMGVFTTKPQFLSAYPQSLSPEVFATRWVENVAKGSATVAAKALAVNQIVEALGAGLSRGDVIYNVVTNIAARQTDPTQPDYDPTDPFIGVARQLANQVKVAQYYTEVLGADSDSMGTLKSILSGVTEQTDVSTPEKLQALVGPLLFDAGRKAEMYLFFSVAFGAVPGAKYWSELREAVESGLSTQKIVEIFTTKPGFLDVYPQNLRPEDFASRLVENVVKASATVAAKGLAAAQIVEALSAGLSRGDVIYNVIMNLAGRETDPAQPGYDPGDPFVRVARQMDNQIKVAEYFTEVLGADASDLSILKNILRAVTDQTDVSTAAKLQAIIDAALLNDPPIFGLTAAAAVVENDAATLAGLVVASYTVPTDEEGDGVTVSFTAGSNAEGYYALNTATRQVTLTSAGATFVNGGGTLPQISLTATDDGSTPASSVQTATPVTTLVNDAPTFSLVAGAAVAENDAATVAGLVVASYTVPTDEEGNAVTVAFTAGSNTDGYYALNTATREVTLTSAGATFVNGGGTLPQISLTATDDGSPRAISVQTVTPVTTLVNDAPVIDTLGASLTYVENDGATVIAPAVTVSDVDSPDFAGGSLTVGFAAAGTGSDQLSIQNQGVGVGQIGVSGGNVSYSGTNIGVVTGGANGADLVISFNSAAATLAAVQALARSITFANTSDDPSTLARSVRFTLRDGDGTAAGGSDTSTSTASVTVTSVNDAPTFSLTAGAAVVENDAATVAGLVVASYTVPSDEEGNAVTVDFTAGSNAEGYYALNTATREVTLTSAGATFVNGGGTLPQISLTATDDGSTPASSVQTATPVTTLVNDAPTFSLTVGADVVENDIATVAGLVVATYTAPTDEEGDGVTVGFTAGSNTEGYYALNTATREVTLTSAGATFVNGGGTLPQISLTATDDGGTPASSVQTATPVTTLVNDAPTFSLTVGADVVENDVATVAGLVVATYTAPTDEEGDGVTVGFTAGSNAEGYYALNTATREVTLTSAGATFVNGGGTLPQISLTATDDGGTPASSVQTATPVTTLVNDAPTFSLTVGADVVENDVATVAGLVVATYTAPTDEEGDGVTVGFTAGSNAEGYYALNTATREVTLTSAGATFVNGGGTLPQISLTATDDGSTPASSVQTATPVTTLVNDAPTFSLTVGADVVENDVATVAGLVVATYTAPTDEEGDGVTVGFTAGSNTDGYYALNTATREVTLTSAGATFVNGGGTLPQISLTATDDGSTPASSVQTATPVTTLVNDAPVIDTLGASLTYVENDGATVIAPAATVSDVDSPDFSGGSLTVGFGTTGTPADQLAVRNEGTGAGEIGVSGADITFGGAVIGSFTGGTNGTDLVVTFNTTAATPAAVQALARSVTFANASDNPSTLARTVSFSLVDGDGTDAGGSDTGSTIATVNITAVNDAPVVGGGGTLAYTENGAAAAISPTGTITDPDSGDFNGGSLKVGFTANGTAADQLVVIHQGAGAGEIGVSGANVSFGGATIGTVSGGASGSDLVVTFTESAATPAAVQALMQAIGFSNDSDAPSVAPRTVTYTVTDGDGGAQTGLATATVNVTTVNDAPATVVPASGALGTAMSNVGFAVAGVSISDVDAGSANVQTTVAVTNGSATFDLAGGATVAAGVNGSASVTLQGTVAQVNAALSTFTFKGADGLAAPTTAEVSVVTNDLGNTGTGGALSSNGGTASTFQIGVIPQVFVIDNSDQVADDASAGTAANPFNTIAGFNALAGDGANDVIYLKHGTGTYAEGGGFTLLAGQQLVGQGEALSFTNPVTGEVVVFGAGAAGTTPTVSITGAGNHAVTLAANNTLKGLNLATTLGSQTALSDGNGTVGTLTVSNVDISGSGMAVDIDQGGALNVTIDSLSSTGSTQQGVQLAATGAALTGTFTATTGAISGATGPGFLVGDGSGTAATGGAVAVSYGGTVNAAGAAAAVSIEDRVFGAGNVTLSGNITRAGGNGTTINVDDIASGAITFSGANSTHSGTTATGLSIADVSSGATVNFSGNLDIDTTSGAGIAIANNGGAVSFTGGQVTINTTSGNGVSIAGGTGSTAFNLSGNGLDIVTTTTGASGFIAANAGTITVQGDSNTIASANGVGLSVSNTTIGAAGLKFLSINASNASSGIVLMNTGATGGLTVTGSGSVAGSGGTISGTTGSAAIVANNTQGLNLSWMNIQNSTGHGINATDLRGVNTLSNSTISGFGTGAGNVEDGFRIVNNNVNMSSLTVNYTTFSSAGNASDGIFMEAQGSSSMKLSVTNSAFTGFDGDAIQVGGITGSTGTVQVTVKDSNFANAVPLGNGGIAMTPFGDLSFFADIDGNTFSNILNNVSTLGAIGVTNGGSSDADITIRNNDLDGIVGGRGITVTADGGTTDLLIDNNTIDGLGASDKAAISVNYTSGTGTATGNVTVSNNLIGQAGSLWTGADGAANAILLQVLDGASMTARIQNNEVAANTLLEVVRVRAAGTGTSVMNATVDGNTLRDTAGPQTAFGATAGNDGEYGTVNLNITNNDMGGGGLSLNEIGSGTLNVTQADLGAVGTSNSAIASASGSPGFGKPLPPLPSPPSLPSPLMAMQGPVAGQDVGTLTLGDLQPVAEAAIARWVEAGIDAGQLALLESVAFGVADLKGSVLGISSGGFVVVDRNAAGWGWFVDATPMVDEEFFASGYSAGQVAARMDLLTVLTHELGHVLGLDDDYAASYGAGVMHGLLDVGQRRMPEVQLVGVVPMETGAGA